DAARNADLLLCEAAILERSQDDPDPSKRGHMTAAEAGEAARDAGARRLLLTHYRADREGLREHHQRAAERAFGRPVEMAEEGQTYTV
ncbi:MAG: MBL fold metallo-hydrolase, partial [Chloroflexi bacterium]|nr:MBL fold metallo-hydrolase [Chloroflexota bacterium]